MSKLGIFFISIMLVAILTELIMINHYLTNHENLVLNALIESKQEPKFNMECRNGFVIAILGTKEQKLFDNHQNPFSCSRILKTTKDKVNHFDIE
jgi:hypothetical protein